MPGPALCLENRETFYYSSVIKLSAMPYKTPYKKVLKIVIFCDLDPSVWRICGSRGSWCSRKSHREERTSSGHLIMIYMKALTVLYMDSFYCLYCQYCFISSPLCNLRSIGGTDLDLLKPLVAVPITAGISLQWFIKVSIWSILIESWKWLWSFYRKRDGNKLWCVPPWFLKLHSWKSFQFHLILFQFLQTFCVWIC